MNKILKQSFWSTIIIYIGVVLGFINSIFLFPKFLSPDQIGLIRQIISASTILIPLATFGVSASYIKFYPTFNISKKEKNEYFTFYFLIISISYLLIFSILNFLFDDIKNVFTEKSDLLFQYFDILLLILLFMSFSSLFEAFLKSRYNTIMNNYVNGVSNRLLTSISIIIFSYGLISFNDLIFLQPLIYFIGLLILVSYSYQIEKFSFNLNFQNIKKSLNKIINFNSYSFLGAFSSMLVLNVDVLMVTSILGLTQTGIYTTAFYIGMIIEIPRRAISQISTPYISENLKNNNYSKIEKNYKDVSLHQCMIGVIFLVIILINLDNIYNIIPNTEKFISGKNVVYIIGISKLIIMSFSYNSELISLSKYYRFTVITILSLALLTIILNLLLIPFYGMEGAALASLISITIFNIIKFLYIKIKMKISPFSINTLKIILIGIFIYYFSSFIPQFENNFLDIILKSTVTMSFYIITLYSLKISPAFNEIIKKIIGKR